VAPVRPNGQLVVPPGATGLVASPAKPGETLLVYGFGFGPVTNTQAIAGSINNALAPHEAEIRVNIGGNLVTPLYAGLTPGFVGLTQINVTIPDLATGSYPFLVQVDGTPIDQSLWLAVQR
jgi:uncharacterized protein (TIGR03437 family)